MHETVQDYYGKQLQTSDDLKTSACCDASAVPGWLEAAARPHPPGSAQPLLRLRPRLPAAA